MEHTHTYITTISEKRGHEFEKDQGGGIWEDLEGGKRENCVIVLSSQKLKN